MAKCSNQNDLAGALGVSKSTVSKYLKRADWPARRRGPWSDEQVEKIKSWRLALQEDRSEKNTPQPVPAGGPNYPQMKLKGDAIKAMSQGEQQLIRARLMKGQVVENEIVEKSLNGITAMYVRSLNNLAASLPGQLAGDRKTNRRIIGDVVRRIREDLIAQREIELIDIGKYTEEIASGTRKLKL